MDCGLLRGGQGVEAGTAACTLQLAHDGGALSGYSGWWQLQATTGARERKSMVLKELFWALSGLRVGEPFQGVFSQPPGCGSSMRSLARLPPHQTFFPTGTSGMNPCFA